MRTKIVYVLSSDKDDIYLEQLMLSIHSLRLYNSSAYIELVIDTKTKASLVGSRRGALGMVDCITVIDVPSIYTKLEVSRWLKTSLRTHVLGDFLFIDTDSIITDDISDVDDINAVVAAVLNVHVTIGKNPARKKMKKWSKRDGWSYNDNLNYFNSGVMLVKDDALSHMLYEKWHERWKYGVDKYNHITDQTYLAAANEEMGGIITEISGIWNCQIIKNGLPFLNEAKIIHYLDFNVFKKTKPWIFYDESIFMDIKKHGIINKRISDLVCHSKSAFPKTVSIVSGNDLDVLQSSTFRLLANNKMLLLLLNVPSFVLLGMFKLYKIITKG